MSAAVVLIEKAFLIRNHLRLKGIAKLAPGLAATRIQHISLLFVPFLLLSVGCVHVEEKRVNHITSSTNDVRMKLEHAAARAALFPLNVAPDISSNFVVGLYPGNLWPIQYALLPFSSLYWGITDAAHGYPFWSPTAPYE